MNEKLAEKLTKILAEKGLENDAIDDVIDEIEDVIAEEDVNKEEDVNPENEVTKPADAKDVDAKNDDVVPPVIPEDDKVVPPAPIEVDAPKGDGTIDEAINDLVAQEEQKPEEVVAPVVAPTDPVVPPAPAIDPSQVEQLIHDLGESNKTIEALKARIDSLEAALKDSGVINSTSPLGDDKPRVTPSVSRDSGEDSLDDILAHINGK